MPYFKLPTRRLSEEKKQLILSVLVNTFSQFGKCMQVIYSH